MYEKWLIALSGTVKERVLGSLHEEEESLWKAVNYLNRVLGSSTVGLLRRY